MTKDNSKSFCKQFPIVPFVLSGFFSNILGGKRFRGEQKSF